MTESRSVTVKPFFIDRYEVTNAEYAAYLRDVDSESPPAKPEASIVNRSKR